MLVIENFPVRNNDSEMVVDLEIIKVFHDNDGIGPYEYWGARGYDHGTSYVSEVEIGAVFYKGKPINSKLLRNVILGCIDYESLYETIEKKEE